MSRTQDIRACGVAALIVAATLVGTGSGCAQHIDDKLGGVQAFLDEIGPVLDKDVGVSLARKMYGECLEQVAQDFALSRHLDELIFRIRTDCVARRATLIDLTASAIKRLRVLRPGLEDRLADTRTTMDEYRFFDLFRRQGGRI